MYVLQYQEKYVKYLGVEKKLKENYGDEKERERKLDLLHYQYDEIKQAKFKIGAEEELETRRKLILNSEKIAQNLNEADSLISENCIDNISFAIRALEKIETIDERLTTVAAHKTMNFLDINKNKKKNIVDTISAIYILETYLNKIKN